jgi:hypothetical protein
MHSVLKRWLASWRREEVHFSLLLLAITSAIFGLVEVAIDALGRS